MPADPADLASMHGRVVDVLGIRIAAGQLTGLVDPASIADEFAISRSLVRECLRTLAAKGMVRARQRSGTVVTPPSSWALLDEQVIRWRASGPLRFSQMEESLQLRSRVEPLAARLTASAASAEAVTDLARATDAISQAARLRDPRRMIEADIAFHRLLYTSSGNAMLAQLAGTVHACLRMPDFQEYRDFIEPDTSLGHTELLDHVRAGDGDAAERACTRLMELTLAVFRGAQSRALGAVG